MKLEMICILFPFILSGCAGISAFVITTTTTPASKTSTPLPTPPLTNYPTVPITGDMYVRDDQGNITGWLYRGNHVQVACSGDWCEISSGSSYSGYVFWRGCSSDNPKYKDCQAR